MCWWYGIEWYQNYCHNFIKFSVINFGHIAVSIKSVCTGENRTLFNFMDLTGENGTTSATRPLSGNLLVNLEWDYLGFQTTFGDPTMCLITFTAILPCRWIELCPPFPADRSDGRHGSGNSKIKVKGPGVGWNETPSAAPFHLVCGSS